jgi:YD repeat-containing protein
LCVAAAAGLGWGSGVAGAYASQPASPDPAGPFSTSLVVPGSPAEGEELQAEREAKLDSPEAVSLREESQTKFEGLDSEQATKVAGEAFPTLVDEPAGGPPKLPAGESLVGFPADNAAQIDLPGGKHGVIESTGPMAVETSPGQRTPVDLSLNDVGNAFEPKTPAVGVKIPKQLGEGVQLSGTGVSLTPVTEQGSALGGSEGTLNGAAVFYANTQTNTDTLAKPMTGGFEIDSLLRSVASPKTLYFKVGMPAEAKLESEANTGGARVVLYGDTIASMAPASAQDAAGTDVPVQMTVSGNTLVVRVNEDQGEYQYPIDVDPRAYDYTMPLPLNCLNYTGEKTDWEFSGSGGSFECYASGESDVFATVGTVNAEEYDELRYPAHGQAQVTYLQGEMRAVDSEQSGSLTKAEFVHGTPEIEHKWTNAGESFGRQLVGTCDQPVIEEGVEHCRALNNENEFRIMQVDTAKENVPEGYGFFLEIYSGAWVSIYQEKGPEVNFNTSEIVIGEHWYNNEPDGGQNVLYGSGGWLDASNGAVGIEAKDPGLGVSYVKIKDLTAGAHGEHWTFADPIYGDHLCTGVWCNETFETKVDPKGTYFTYNKEMAEGENTFELCAEDEASMSACKDTTVKVDNTPPSKIKLSGLAETGAEISATPHQLTVEATDATSGIKSITVSLDGREIGGPAANCSPGECTAKGTWTINGESLGTGEHKLEIFATDDAGNVSAKKIITFAIRNATPVKLGPGSVDPVTGQFALSASDVTMAGAGSVSRSYDSRSPAANLESPLGPQWSLHTGTGQSLKLLPDGSAELQGSGGEPTIFASNEKGGFEAPKGDGNLTLESKEKEAGKGITEYLLKNPAAGTTSRFVLPGGSHVWVVAATEGTAASEKTSYAYQTGEQPTEYQLAAGSEPSGITAGPDGNLWVSQSGSDTVSKVTTAGAVTENKLTSPFSCPNYIAAGPENESKLWFTDNCDHQIGRITTSGGTLSFNFTSGVELQGIIAGPAQSLWFAMEGVSKIGKITTSGVVSEYALPSGSQPRGITAGPGSVLFFTDYGTSKIGQISTTGTLSEFSLPSGSQPVAITEGPEGFIWYADYGTSRVGKLTPIIEPTEALGPVPAGVTCGKNPQEVKLEEITAGGESASEWGEYTGRLKKVSFTAYSPASKAMQTTAVAEYSYDKQGRLRAEWDPRISPGLKITYGYDSEGHVTAVSPAGQQPWLLHYGAIASEPSTGRLLSITRSGAASALWNGETLKNTAAPTLSSTSPVIGTTLSVSSNGTWSNGPLTYGYQWEDCTGSQCTAIAGATNHGYTPQASDAGYTLVAQVTATNAGGSVVASSVATSAVPISAPKYSLAFGSSGTEAGKVKEPTSTAVDSSGDVWVTDPGNARIDEFSSSGGFIKTLGFGVSNGKAEFETCTSSCQAGIAGSGNGQFSGPWGIAVNRAAGDVYVSDQANRRVEEFTTAGAFVRAFGVEHLDITAGVGVDPNGNVWVADCGGNDLAEFDASGDYQQTVGSAGSGNGQFSCPGGFAFVGGNMYVADFGNKRVQKLSLSGGYLGQFASVGEPYEINENAVTGEIYESDFAGKVDEFNQAGTLLGSFGTKGIGSGQFEHPTGLAVNSSGVIYVVDASNNRLQEWTPTYSTNNPLPEPPSAGSSSVSTVEYRVPLLGSSAPYQMTSTELAKWGQTKDLPEEATAIFPPDEPQGWPASSYKRATVLYMDGQARTTNTASPSGAISTVEYNTLNEVTRTLTAADRAIALKETGKTAEAAKALSSEKIYNSAGTQLLETYGPEHKIKLASGTEEETRNRQKFSYNEGEPSKEEAYDLLTKSASWAEGTGHKELGKHETVTSYNGQENLGWKLRKPTLMTSVVEGHTTTTTTKYEKETGGTLEATSSVSLNAPVYASQFGTKGTAGGQFEGAEQDAVDAHGNVWVADYSNHRIQQFSSSGAFMLAVGWGVRDGKAEAETCATSCRSGISGSGSAQFEGPWGIAINQSTGNLYVADYLADRVEEFSSTGAFVTSFGSKGSGGGQFTTSQGVAIDSSGDVWVADYSNQRIEEFSSSGTFMLAAGWGVKDGKSEAETCTTTCQAGIKGSGNGELNGPTELALANGDLYVSDYNNYRVDEFSSAGVYMSKFGSKGSGNGQFEGPTAIAVDPSSGELYVADPGNARVQEFTNGGIFLTTFGSKGSESGQFGVPVGVTVSSSGSLDVSDHSNNRIEEWEPVPSTPAYTSRFGMKGSASGQLEGPQKVAADSHGDLWVADYHNKRIEEFSSTGAFMLGVGWGVKDGKAEAETCTTSCQAGISGTGNGQFEGPFGIAVNQTTGNVYVSDFLAGRVEEFSSIGAFVATIGAKGTGGGQFLSPEAVSVDSSGNLWVADSANHRIQELSSTGTFTLAVGWGVKDGKAEAETCTASCLVGISGIGNGQLSTPTGIAFSDGNLYVSDYTNDRVVEFSSAGGYLSAFGSEGSANGKFVGPYDIAADPTSGNLYVDDRFNYRIQAFTPAGGFLAKFGSNGSGNGQFAAPQGVTVNSTGSIYVGDNGGDYIDGWHPAPRPGNEGARDTRTVYYTAKGEAELTACQNHPEWTGLVCQVEPTAQPGDSGPPLLPVTTITYNMWYEPETVTEKIGSVTRTTKKTHDSAGRLASTEETSTSSEDTALSAVSDEYNSETGALAKETETTESKARSVTSIFNTLGRIVSYTDAEGATTKYVYDVDGRVEEVSEPKGSQVYAYDPTTGFLTKLADSAAGTFTATFGVSGEILTETYPNGLAAKYTYNAIGQATKLEYEKTTHCTEKCVWFSDAEAFGPEGGLVTQTSTLASEAYTYNEAGQLTQTEETPAGGTGCITRSYAYDEVSEERLSLTTSEPNEKGECTTQGGLVETHNYDVVGRLLDPGVTYDPLGNMTKVPALDAGGQAITSTFYVDNQIATQEQAEKSIAYTYDPAGRMLVSKAKHGASTTRTVSHYAGPEEGTTWSCEEEEGKTECEEGKVTKWKRNIPGIDGSLDAIQTNGEAPVLQLQDLGGDVVATVEDSETATKLLSTYNSTEFGTSSNGKTPKYAWLGATGVESELETGVITSAGATYVPQTARTLDTTPIAPPGAEPNGVMATEAYDPPALGWANQSGKEGAANTVAEERAIERAAFEAALLAEANASLDDPEKLYQWREALQWAEAILAEAHQIKTEGIFLAALPILGEYIAGGAAGVASIYERWGSETSACGTTAAFLDPKGRCFIKATFVTIIKRIWLVQFKVELCRFAYFHVFSGNPRYRCSPSGDLHTESALDLTPIELQQVEEHNSP